MAELEKVFFQSIIFGNNYLTEKGEVYDTFKIAAYPWTTGIKVWLQQFAFAYLVLVNIDFQSEPLVASGF